MKRFEDLLIGESFSMGVWELKPNFENEKIRNEFLNKYVFSAFIQKVSLTFVKTGVKTCKEVSTGTPFELRGAFMSNDEAGLTFIGNYVNENAAKNKADKRYVRRYFVAAEEFNSCDAKTRTNKK